ncbi:MAG TPA: hypothetical protein DET40_05140 [Lentisphaeria bacterium]|nr:MAG: hypothetical protein A2X45_20365 [Lentisphaerae bacterium GWF2_50_93]HCE42911.1 hypothetical protein [Lentisphaeria bacterium]
MKLLEIFTDRNKRNMLVVSILVIVLAVAVYIQFIYEPPAVEGALRVVRCPDCDTQSVQRIKDISDTKDAHNKCHACGKMVGYAFKCEDCDREFSMVPVEKLPPEGVAKMRTMGKFTYALQMQKCPNCGSIRTRPISVPND